MNRHGARSYLSNDIENQNLPKNFFGNGVEAGSLTDIGRIE
jgi:hypothetical protein